MPQHFVHSSPQSNSQGVSIGGEAKRRAAARARKAGLLGEAARHFCGMARPTHHDITVFRELFYQLVDGSDKSERRILAASLARNVYTPRTILLYLALDDYDIAAPILLFCDALNEMDIKGLTQRLGQPSLEILCRRASLTVGSVRSLMAAGGSRCRDILAKNPALNNDAGIQSLLAGQEPLEVEDVLVETRMDHLASVARQDTPEEPKAIITAAETSVVPAFEARQSAQQTLTAIAGRGGRLGRENAPAIAISFDPAKPLEPQLVKAARAGNRPQMAAALEAWCELPSKSSLAILERGGPAELIVLFKGLGLSDLGTVQCLLQLDAQVARNISAYNEAKAMLTTIDVQACRRFVESLGANLRKPLGKKLPEAQMEIDISALRAIAAQRRREILASVGQSPGEIVPVPFSTLKSA
jgi:uncharacterized protein (DUF2336 family)